MLETVAIVGSAIGAMVSIWAAFLSRKERERRVRDAGKNARKVTLKVDGRSYKVKASPQDIDRLLGARQ